MRFGLLTPMANPTVEAEFRRLLPTDADYVVARLTSAANDPADRLVNYATRVGETVRQFGNMPMDAIGFACTASSYLIGPDREAAIASSFDLPFLFAARAVADWIAGSGAKRIAVISPYPPALHTRGLDYWRRAGFELVWEARVELGTDDTRSIYALSGVEARPLVDAAKHREPDLILLSGTGMPTLDLLDPNGSPPVVSSNSCLAAALVETANG